MSEPPTLGDEVTRELARSTARLYRINVDDAAAIIAPIVEGDAALQRAIATKADLAELRRMRVFKDVEKAARRLIYAQLRRYKRSEDAIESATQRLETLAPGEEPAAGAAAVETILASHTSTAERLDHQDEFRAAMLRHAAGARTILDVACGMMPLMFPFEEFPQLDRYVALDRDRASVRAVRAFARWSGLRALRALQWAVADGWGPVETLGEARPFDVAFLFKLVPVIARQEPAMLETLSRTPARRLVVTGSVHGLVKRQSILRREERDIRLFVERFGFSVEDHYVGGNELIFVLAGGDLA